MRMKNSTGEISPELKDADLHCCLFCKGVKQSCYIFINFRLAKNTLNYQQNPTLYLCSLYSVVLIMLSFE